MLEDLKKDARDRMGKCVQTFQAELKKQRTGRAHPSLVEHLEGHYYDAEVPLHQIASINVEDGRTLVISPWEKTVVPAIEKAIHKSDLGLTPMTAGTVIRVPMPLSPKSAAARSPRWCGTMRKTRASRCATCAAM
jgi:ribosome recycling factor